MKELTITQAVQAIEDIDPQPETRSIVIIDSGPERDPYTTTIQTIGGWKAVLITWEQGVPGPENTGFYAYDSEADAVRDAMSWARTEEIKYIPRQKHDD